MVEIPDKRPPTYRLLDTCSNCAHVFEMGDYDDPYFLFCAKDALERPLCGSIAMKEAFFPEQTPEMTFGERDRVYEERSRAWDEWSQGREVRASGTCDSWRKRDKDEQA
jgi:hypothetical protein